MLRSSSQTEVLPFTSQRGFTLIELIMVMVVVGILAVFVMPRLFDAGVFRSRGFSDQVAASLRYAQKVAIAQRRVVCVTFNAPAAPPNSVTLTIDSNTPADGVCNAAPAGNLQSLSGDPSYVVSAPTGTTFAAVPADFSFDAQGRPSAGQVINVAGAVSAVTIEAETGYVH